MTFNDLFFLFLFLPVAIGLYHLVPKAVKDPLLVVLSLVFYAWGSPAYLVILLFSLCFNYLAGLQLGLEKRKWQLWSAVAVNILLLSLYKYYGGLTELINRLFGTGFASDRLPMPVGLSFYTFTALSYLLDVYRGKTAAQKNFLKYSLYMCFFPKLTSGPIVRYEQMEPQLRERKLTRDSLGSGISKFLVGLGKKVLIADTLGAVFTQIRGLEDMAALTAWLGLLCYTFQLYFDFSGYSDMAIGLGTVFGFRFEKNFDYPYQSAGISEFWRRWHISLGAWFREYVYIPLGGNRCGKGQQIRNLLAVWALTGIWHGSTLNFLVWGLYHGALVLLEKFLLKDILEKIPRAIRVGLTFLAVYIGWAFFFSGSLGESFRFLGAMLGSGGLANGATWYYLGGSWVLLLLAALGSTPLPRRIYTSLVYWGGSTRRLAAVIGGALLFVGCVAYLVASTYSSFLYFQF